MNFATELKIRSHTRLAVSQSEKSTTVHSRERVIKQILTSVKAETTDAVLPNCVGCSLWNTCRRFFANLVLTCKVAEFRDKYTMLNTLHNIWMIQSNQIFYLPAFLIFTRKIPHNIFAVTFKWNCYETTEGYCIWQSWMCLTFCSVVHCLTKWVHCSQNL